MKSPTQLMSSHAGTKRRCTSAKLNILATWMTGSCSTHFFVFDSFLFWVEKKKKDYRKRNFNHNDMMNHNDHNDIHCNDLMRLSIICNMIWGFSSLGKPAGGGFSDSEGLVLESDEDQQMKDDKWCLSNWISFGYRLNHVFWVLLGLAQAVCWHGWSSHRFPVLFPLRWANSSVIGVQINSYIAPGGVTMVGGPTGTSGGNDHPAHGLGDGVNQSGRPVPCDPLDAIGLGPKGPRPLGKLTFSSSCRKRPLGSPKRPRSICGVSPCNFSLKCFRTSNNSCVLCCSCSNSPATRRRSAFSLSRVSRSCPSIKWDSSSIFCNDSSSLACLAHCVTEPCSRSMRPHSCCSWWFTWCAKVLGNSQLKKSKLQYSASTLAPCFLTKIQPVKSNLYQVSS